MKLESQVSNLELSKRLKELGVKQESQFAWKQHRSTAQALVHWKTYRDNKPSDDFESYSAFTVAELGEMLPRFYTSGKGDKDWYCDYYAFVDTDQKQNADTEADARAKMLIYLIENKLITL